MREREIAQWILDGDPAVRWQALRDLEGAHARVVDAERARVETEGWGKRLLDRQSASGRWADDRGPAGYRGLYTPKWVSTTYTMLLLRHLGLPPRSAAARAGCRELVEGAEWFPSGGLGYFASRRIAEPCVSALGDPAQPGAGLAMVLSVLEAFDYDEAPRARIARFLVADDSDARRADGGWNCEIGATHSSFNTTCAALDALSMRPKSARTGRVVARGLEFFLEHQLFCSHRTGKPARAIFARLGPLVGWRYDLLRGLELFARVGAPRDRWLEKAIDYVVSRRRSDGRWNGAARPPGAMFFELEAPGAPSRWTTLRCLRVLRWWDAALPMSADGSADVGRRRVT